MPITAGCLSSEQAAGEHEGKAADGVEDTEEDISEEALERQEDVAAGASLA